MSTTTNWAVGTGLAIVLVAIGGTALWRHKHPPGAPLADLMSVLPKIPRLDPAPKPAAPSPVVSAANPEPEKAKSERPGADDSAAIVLPRFDVARVEKGGDAIVAGSGAPNSKVALMAGGKVLAETQSDANGQFVLLPPPLTLGDQTLTLRQSPVGNPVVSSQKLVLTMPSDGRGQVVIALAEPGKPTRTLSTPVPSNAPLPQPAAAPAAPPRIMAAVVPKPLSIQSAAIENGNGFKATGVATPGTQIRLYLNNSHLADVVAGRDGQWQLVIRRGLAGGHYAVRAEAMSPGNQVIGRVDVPFDVPFDAIAATSVSPADSRSISSNGADVAVADAPPVDAVPPLAAKTPDPNEGSKPVQATIVPPNPTLSASSDPASAVIDAIETRQVFGGDNLWNISRERLGDGMRFPQIYAANANQIKDPNLIYPGQIFVLPRK